MDSPGGFPVAGLAITSPGPDELPSSPSASPVSFGGERRSRSLELQNDILHDGTVDGRSLTQPYMYGAPAEPSTTITTGHHYTTDPSKQRNQYFEDAFAYKDTGGSVRERIHKDTPILAELRTNVIVEDEHTLVTSLSHQLSTRYQRSESSIVISVTHSACVCLAGSFEPAYILTVSALPVHLQPTTNKRNTALITTFLTDILCVPPERGLIRFQAIAEENLAIGGATVLGEIERLEKQQAEENGRGVKRATTGRSGRTSFSKRSFTRLRSNGTLRSKEAPAHHEDTMNLPPPGRQTPLPSPHLALPSEERKVHTNFHYPVRPPARKQFESETENGVLHGLERTSSLKSPTITALPQKMPPVPAVPIDHSHLPPEKLKKRKSLFAVFKKDKHSDH